MDSNRLSSYWDGLLTLDQVREWLYELFSQARIPLERREQLFGNILDFLNQFDVSDSWFGVLKQVLLEVLTNPSITPGFNPYFAGLLRVIRQAHSKAITSKTRAPLSDEELLLFNTLLRFIVLPADFSKETVVRIKNAHNPSELLDILLDTFFFSLGQQVSRSKERLVELLRTYILDPLTAINLEFTSSKQTLHIIRRFDAYFVPRVYIVPHYRALGLFHGLLQLRKTSLEVALEMEMINACIPSMTFLGVAFHDPFSDQIYIETLLSHPLEALELDADFSEYESYSYYLNPTLLLKIPSEMVSRHYYFRSGMNQLEPPLERFLEDNHVIMHGGRVETVRGAIRKRTIKETEKLTAMIEKEIICEYPWISPPTIIGSYNRPILIRTDPIPFSQIQKFESLLQRFPIVDISKTNDLWLIRVWTDPRDPHRSSKVTKFLQDLKNIANNVSLIDIFQNIRGKRMPSNCYAKPPLRGIRNTWWSGKIGALIPSKTLMERAKRLGYSTKGNTRVIELSSPLLLIRFRVSDRKTPSFEILRSETANPRQIMHTLSALLQSSEFTLRLDRLVISTSEKRPALQENLDALLSQHHALPSLKSENSERFYRKSEHGDEIWLLRTRAVPLSIPSIRFLTKRIMGET